MNITGTMVNYLVVCPRKLWLSANGVGMEFKDELVQLGKLVDKTSFREGRRQVKLGSIVIDVVKREGGEAVLFEIKKSSRLSVASRLQTLYYLWYLKHNYGQTIEAVVSYPKERRREYLELGSNEEKEVEEAIKKISAVMSVPIPPAVEPKRYCKKCAYYEFCMV